MTIEITNLRKRRGTTEIYEGLSLKPAPGRITAVFGPNACGKSTIFNILAGLLHADGGTCTLDNADMQSLSYVFQNYRETLLPWRTVYQNIAFPLELRGMSEEDIQVCIEELEAQLGLLLPMQRYPYELSGGQQQMVAFFRALVTKPKLVLLDEPFSALDYESAAKLHDALQKYCEKENPTVLIITHDMEESTYLADSIVVLSKKPTRIVGIVHNPLPYPRTVETLKSAQFHNVKNKVLELFQEGAR